MALDEENGIDCVNVIISIGRIESANSSMHPASLSEPAARKDGAEPVVFRNCYPNRSLDNGTQSSLSHRAWESS